MSLYLDLAVQNCCYCWIYCRTWYDINGLLMIGDLGERDNMSLKEYGEDVCFYFKFVLYSL